MKYLKKRKENSIKVSDDNDLLRNVPVGQKEVAIKIVGRMEYNLSKCHTCWKLCFQAVEAG